MGKHSESPLPSRLKIARKTAGLSQEKLGIMAGLDESTASPRMNQYEKGVHAPDFRMVKTLSKILKVPTAYFYCEEDELAKIILTFKSKG
ncbi:helix-turn-helix domain-containing protein [Shewanella halifaxensis]|uniref:helix-turn-helix domain-containing protein n=1 Tax=Shewanella halifaxensis TaxID=271098 RepID=UPI000D59F821|nr:helix-turn-helix transcriptional regulator [Shewanella halifaxensis]